MSRSPYIILWLLNCCLLFSSPGTITAEDGEQSEDNFAAPERLGFIENVIQDDLERVTSVSVSNNGKFVYATAYMAGAVTVFSRDQETGKLEHLQTTTDVPFLNGSVALRLSPDNKYAAVASFRANTVTLLMREPNSGVLEVVDTVDPSDDQKLMLDWTIDIAWSPDSKFVYSVADQSSAVNAFQVTDDRLELVQVVSGAPADMQGGRGTAVSPDGKMLYVASDDVGQFTVFERNPETGELTFLQSLRDGDEDLETIGGAFCVTVSADNKFVYLTSGRFQGDSTVSVFSRQEDGQLELIQTLGDEANPLEDYLGGNEIAISADGKTCYSVGSRSNSLCVFARDPQTGRLQQTQSIVTGQRAALLDVASGVAISPDGKFVYVAAEGNNSITIFRHYEKQADE